MNCLLPADKCQFQLMPNPRLAGRYAKSLVDLAIEKNQLDKLYEDMVVLQQVCRDSRDFVILLKSPIIPSDKKEKVFDALAKDRLSVLTVSFCKLLIKKGRESYLPEIVSAFIQQYKDHQGIYIVKLTTATPVSDALKKAIVDKIKSTTSMKNIELNTEVNEAIIGGFVLEVADRMVDASVAFDLNNIRKQFLNNEFIYRIR